MDVRTKTAILALPDPVLDELMHSYGEMVITQLDESTLPIVVAYLEKMCKPYDYKSATLEAIREAVRNA